MLDASVLIGHFEPADEHHDRATALLHSYRDQTFAASVITLAEIFAGAARAGQLERTQALLDQLEVEDLALPVGAGRRLGELRTTSGLKMPDCCVLYAAEQHGAAIATFDERLARQAGRLGLSIARIGKRKKGKP